MQYEPTAYDLGLTDDTEGDYYAHGLTRDEQRQLIWERAQPVPESWLEPARPSTEVRADPDGTARLHCLHAQLDEGHLAAARQVLADERVQDGAISAAFADSRAEYLRSLYSERQREQLAAQRDMTPGAPHPDPRLAAKGWQASDHGTYVRRPPEHEAEAG